MSKLRKIEKSDIHLIFEWANDEISREMAINSKPISWEEHNIWFKEKINDGNCFFYILQEKENNLGNIRFDKNDQDEYLISYSIDKNHRGRGLGNTIISKGIKKILSVHSNCTFVAYVLESNIPSLKIFANHLFKKTDEKIINNKRFFIFKKEIKKDE